MNKIYFDGLANPYIIPDNKTESKRSGVYALVYIKNIDSFMLTAPMPHIDENQYKMAGGGVENTENNLETIKRELIEEVGYPIDKNFKLIDEISYEFNFRPAKTTDEYWLQNNTYYLYEVDSLENSGYPSTRWISEQENILVKIVSKKELLENPENMHFVQRMALKRFVDEIYNEKILYMNTDDRIS